MKFSFRKCEGVNRKIIHQNEKKFSELDHNKRMRDRRLCFTMLTKGVQQKEKKTNPVIRTHGFNETCFLFPMTLKCYLFFQSSDYNLPMKIFLINTCTFFFSIYMVMNT